jgi:hypothetical protein
LYAQGEHLQGRSVYAGMIFHPSAVILSEGERPSRRTPCVLTFAFDVAFALDLSGSWQPASATRFRLDQRAREQQSPTAQSTSEFAGNSLKLIETSTRNRL